MNNLPHDQDYLDDYLQVSYQCCYDYLELRLQEFWEDHGESHLLVFYNAIPIHIKLLDVKINIISTEEVIKVPWVKMVTLYYLSHI